MGLLRNHCITRFLYGIKGNGKHPPLTACNTQKLVLIHLFLQKGYQQPTTPPMFVFLSWAYCDSLGALLSDSHACHCHPQIPTTDMTSQKWQRLADSNLKMILFMPALALAHNMIETSSLRWKRNLHRGVSTGNLNHNDLSVGSGLCFSSGLDWKHREVYLPRRAQKQEERKESSPAPR